MVYDATHLRSTGEVALKQLFISRSSKIKNWVQRVVEAEMKDPLGVERDFFSYDRVLHDCNEALTGLGLHTKVPAMEKSKRGRDFSSFRDDFFEGIKKNLKVTVTALVVWTQIR